MPEDEPTTIEDGPVFSSYGIASAALGVVAVIAVALAAVIFVQHRQDTDELQYRARVMQTAADWTTVLINMNADTVSTDMVKLHEGTVGQLNAEFESAVEPYRKLVQTLKSHTTGQIDSVSVESIYHPPPGPDGARPQRSPEISEFASRTDTVLVIATSVSENVGDEKPKTVRWNLRLDVSDVDGKLMISRLETIR